MPAMLRPEDWTKPTGESLVRVSTGAPGSRPQPEGENPPAERGVKSLFGGSKSAGRSIKRILQPRQIHNGKSRAAHVTAKAMSAAFDPEIVRRVFPGYGDRHALTVWFGTGETRLCGLSSGKDRSYKPMVKSSGAQRESERVVVPSIGVHDNAPGGKDPYFGRACEGGKR